MKPLIQLLDFDCLPVAVDLYRTMHATGVRGYACG